MAIESKNLLVWVKAMSRGQALPLDASEIYDSLAAAQNYAKSAIAYGGQTIKALLDDGKYHEYILQPSGNGYVLEEVDAALDFEQKQFVIVVDTLPTSGQQQGVLYIDKTNSTGSIWTGSAWKEVFRNVQATLTSLQKQIDAANTEIAKKAPINNPNFTGTVKVENNEVAVKSYVDGLFQNLKESSVPRILNSQNPIGTAYKAGDSYRVSENGTYAGQKCEAGDLVLVINDYNNTTASNDDFIVVQANIDGAVTSSTDTATVGEIVVFDSLTGKVVKGSGVQIASLNDAISNTHTHENKAVLDTYNKNQSELIEAAKSESQNLVNALNDILTDEINKKANKATSLAGYGITDAYTETEIDAKLKTITDNLNTKVTAKEVETSVDAAKSYTDDKVSEVKSKLDNTNVTYGTCETESANANKVVTVSNTNWDMTAGSIVLIKFTYDVSAAATMNINGKGAKAIHYRGIAITNNVIKAGDIATFVYDGSVYHLIGLDRDENTTYGIATDTTAGIVKLYDNTYEYNTDGAVTQNCVAKIAQEANEVLELIKAQLNVLGLNKLDKNEVKDITAADIEKMYADAKTAAQV